MRASARSDATGKAVASGARAVEGGKRWTMLTLAEDTHEHQSAYTSTRVGPLATPASKLSSLSSTTRPSGRSVAIAGAARHTSASVRSVARMAGARATKSVTRGRDVFEINRQLDRDGFRDRRHVRGGGPDVGESPPRTPKRVTHPSLRSAPPPIAADPRSARRRLFTLAGTSIRTPRRERAPRNRSE